ncbi:hypothetical protein FRC00_014138 [Tulasnella sp. 408]|nr:hypothetical protein FRC00_014138 [Tulasnella sp. 408]
MRTTPGDRLLPARRWVSLPANSPGLEPDQGKARIDMIPEELHIYEKTNERPVDARKGKPGAQSSGLAAIEASTAALAQAVQLVTMTFGAGRGLTPPPSGSTVNTSNSASASVSTNTAQGSEAPQSPSIQRHLRETIIYPTIESWLARLEATDPDKHAWTQYTADLHANRYLRINQLADTRLMSSEKLMRIVGGLQEGAADYLLAMAMDECAELQAVARKAFLKA